MIMIIFNDNKIFKNNSIQSKKIYRNNRIIIFENKKKEKN